nr:RecName: Full=Uncharacterized protein IMPP10 [Nautilus macromphalus]
NSTMNSLLQLGR